MRRTAPRKSIATTPSATPAGASSVPPPEAAPPLPAEPGFADDQGCTGLLAPQTEPAAARFDRVVGLGARSARPPTIASQKAAEAAVKAAQRRRRRPGWRRSSSRSTRRPPAEAVPTELAQTTAAKLGAAQARQAELAEAKRGLGMDCRAKIKLHSRADRERTHRFAEYGSVARDRIGNLSTHKRAKTRQKLPLIESESVVTEPTDLARAA